MKINYHMIKHALKHSSFILSVKCFYLWVLIWTYQEQKKSLWIHFEYFLSFFLFFKQYEEIMQG